MEFHHWKSLQQPPESQEDTPGLREAQAGAYPYPVLPLSGIFLPRILGRGAAALWVDKTGTVWLFGGYNFRTGNFFNDLFSFSQGEWTWQKGSELTNQPATFGTKGTANASNIPGARRILARWLDSDGSLRLFGSEPLALGLNFRFWIPDNSLETSGLHDIWRVAP